MIDKNLGGVQFDWSTKAKYKSKIADLRVPWAAIVGVEVVVDSLTGAEAVAVPKAENIWISKAIIAYFSRGITNTLLISKKENYWPYVTRAER